MALLEVENLTKSFGTLSVLRGLSFHVDKGEIYGLVATNGTGKSTTLRILLGLVGADSGSATVAGLRAGIDGDAVRERVGYMPQHFSLYGDLTVEENLHFFADMFFVGKRERAERIEKLYTFSRLKPFAKRPTGRLSGGMQKKLTLMCGMMHQPEILLLDEPTTGVDPISRRELWETLYGFAAQGVSMLVSTPYFDEAERCHRVGLLHEGRLIADESPRVLIERQNEWVFEREGVESRRARDAVLGAPGVLDAYLVGEFLRIAAPPETDVAGIVARRLGEAGLPVGRVTRGEPTFEDVFISRVREAGNGR